MAKRPRPSIEAVRPVAIFLMLALPAAAPAGEGKVEYNRDIRPIFVEICFRCHGPDGSTRRADLRLDRREAAIAAGAIVPGHPEKSLIVERIFSDTKPLPPRASGKTLAEARKEKLRRWIVEGAEYQPHWAFVAPVRPPLPPVRDGAWPRTAIDRFVLAELEAAGLPPAPEADRRTLARRASLDLTGLPPAPADVEALAADPAPHAYERFVDRLLESPAWGEHRARYWLDAARYADTHGIHFDNYREMWSYRSWVIDAFNANVPFDRFAVEQLGGDLLPGSTLDQKIATGFNRCNITTNEGGAIAEEYLVLYARDRTETAARVFLGLTAGCAACHDHKYDPLTQREFYELTAFFDNTTQAAMDGNVRDTPPVVFVPRPEDRGRWDALAAETAAAREAREARRGAARPDFDRWLSALPADEIGARIPREGLHLAAPLAEGTGSVLGFTVDGEPRCADLGGDVAWEPGQTAAKAARLPPGKTLEVSDAGDFERDRPFTLAAWIKLPRAGIGGAVAARMDDGRAFRGWDLWLENGALGSHVIHRWPDDALKVVSRTPLPANRWVHVAVAYDGSSAAKGVTLYADGKRQEANVAADALRSTIRAEVPFKVNGRNASARIDDLLVQDVRLYSRRLSPEEVEGLVFAGRALGFAGRPAGERAGAERQVLFDSWLTGIDRTYRDLSARLGRLEGETAAIQARGTVAHVSRERDGPPRARVLFRGDYDKPRDEVGPGTPAFLPPFPEEEPLNRLGLGRWLVRPEHPLTARVTVNRFWQEVFGTGLVKTSEDFGMSGELPSHPALLDWLAAEFREGGWDVKRFFRLLVTSAAYRQAAVATPEKLEKDPGNRLISRGPRFRMDAEMVRDLALAASGLLAKKIGGPSVKPYQPDGVWEAVAIIGSDTREYRRDGGENLYRRSLYTFWKRSAPPASMEIFNAPSRENCTVRRERTDTPLQALVTLDDPQFVEASRALAVAAIREGGESAERRMDVLAMRLLSRHLRPEEASLVRSLADDLVARYRGKPEEARALIAVGESKADPALDPAVVAGWTMVANALLNLDEVLNK